MNPDDRSAQEAAALEEFERHLLSAPLEVRQAWFAETPAMPAPSTVTPSAPPLPAKARRSRLLTGGVAAVVVAAVGFAIVRGSLFFDDPRQLGADRTSLLLANMIIPGVAGSKNPETAIVYSGDDYEFGMHFATPAQHAYLVAADNEAAVRRATATNRHGEIELRCAGEFDVRECWEYMIAILTVRDEPVLDQEHATWLSETEIAELQQATDLTKARQLLEDALKAAGIVPVRVEVRRYRHEFAQRPTVSIPE